MSSKQYLVKFNELSICTGPLDGHLHDVWRRRHGRHRPWRWKHKPSAHISETTHLQHIYTAQESLRCCFLVAVALCSPIGSQCITSLLICISVTSPAVTESQKLNDVRWLWISVSVSGARISMPHTRSRIQWLWRVFLQQRWISI